MRANVYYGYALVTFWADPLEVCTIQLAVTEALNVVCLFHNQQTHLESVSEICRCGSNVIIPEICWTQSTLKDFQIILPTNYQQ